MYVGKVITCPHEEDYSSDVPAKSEKLLILVGAFVLYATSEWAKLQNVTSNDVTTRRTKKILMSVRSGKRRTFPYQEGLEPMLPRSNDWPWCGAWH